MITIKYPLVIRRWSKLSVMISVTLWMDMFSYRADFQSQSSVKVSYDKEHGDEAIVTNVS